MGAWSQSEIRPVLPVRLIVPAFPSLSGKVRNLVLPEARRREPLGGFEELGRVTILVCERLLALRDTAPEWRCRLRRQAIERHVRRLQLEDAIQVGRPVAPESRGQAEDQIDADVLDARCPRQRHCAAGAVWAVQAAHPAQGRLVKRLRAEADAVY